MREFEDEFDIVLRNHGSFSSPKAILADSIELCGEILERRDAAVSDDFMGMKGCLARPHKHPGKVGNILYNPDKLFEQ